MKQFKFIGIVLILLLSLMSVNAIGTAPNPSNTELYYTFDTTNTSGTTMYDTTPNNNDGTCTGMTNCNTVTGKLNQATSFDGTNDYIIVGDVGEGYSELSISVWFYSDVLTGAKDIITNYVASSNRAFSLSTTNDEVTYLIGDNSNNIAYGTTTDLNLAINTWYNIILNYDGTNTLLYVDNVLKFNSTAASGNTDTTTSNTEIGSRNSGHNFFNGKIDEIAIFDKSLSQDEMDYLYQGGAPTTKQQWNFTNSIITPVLSFTNITVNDVTLINNTYFNTSDLDFYVEVLNTSTNGDIDLYYSLNSSSNINTPTEFNFNLNLTEGNYNISFYAENNETNVTSSTYNFIVDTSSPTINNNIPSEINTYLFNGSSFSCTDDNLLNCTIKTKPTDYIYPAGCNENLTFCNIPQGDNFNYTTNGNKSYTIFATDSAGNIARESGTILVNPIQYFYADDSLSGIDIDDFTLTIGGTEFSTTTGVVSFPIYDIGLGTKSFSIESYGYDAYTDTIVLNTTSDYNLTTSLNRTTLSIQVFDIGNINNQLTFDVVIENDTFTKSYTSQLDFQANFSELPSGVIKMTIDSSGYEPGFLYTTLTPYTSISKTSYLYAENSTSVITFQLLDFETSNSLGNVLVDVNTIVNGSYESIQQAVTSSSGFVYFNLDPSIDYKFIFSSDGYTQAEVLSIPSVFLYTIRLKQDSDTFEYIDGVSYYFTPISSLLYNGTSYNLTSFINGVSITLSQFEVTVDGVIVYSDTNTNPSGTTFTYPIDVINQSKIITTLTYYTEGKSNTISKEYTVQNLTDSEIMNLMNFGKDASEEAKLWRLFIMIMVFAGVSIASIGRESTRDYVAGILLLPLILFWYVGWIGPLYGAILLIALIIMFMGGNKR